MEFVHVKTIAIFIMHVHRNVTRLDGTRDGRQVWHPFVWTWVLSEANVLCWKKYLWHCWDFSAPSTV